MSRDKKYNKFTPKNSLFKQGSKLALKVTSALTVVFALHSSSNFEFYDDPDRFHDAHAWSERIDTIKTAETVIQKIANTAYVSVPIGTIRTEFIRQLSEQVGSSPLTLNHRANTPYEFAHVVNKLLKHKKPAQYRHVTFDAMNALVKSLDPHSAFLDPYEAMRRADSFNFGRPGTPVIEPMISDPQSPAPHDGAPVETDMVTEIETDPSDIKIENFKQFFNDLLKIPTRIGINLQTAPENNMTDAPWEYSPVKTSLLPGNIGYVTLESFTRNSDAHLINAISDMELAATPPQSYILDLRDNLGGYMQEAVSIVDSFVNSGTIMTTINYDGSTKHYSANPGDVINGKPLVVLVNDKSASSSEIVAGALQHLNRATIVGSVSFGKGSFQTTYDYGKAGALVLTTGMYYLGGKISIQGVGLTPDIKVMFGDATKINIVKESNLANRLLNMAPPEQKDSPAHCFRALDFKGLLPPSLQNKEGHIDSALACAVSYLENKSVYAVVHSGNFNISRKELRLIIK